MSTSDFKKTYKKFEIKFEENRKNTYHFFKFQRRLKRVRPQVLRELLTIYYCTFITDFIGIQKLIGSGKKIKPGISAIEDVLGVSRGKAYDLLAACDTIRSVFVGYELDYAKRRAYFTEERLRESFLNSMSASDYEKFEKAFASCFSDVAMMCGVQNKSGKGKVSFSQVRKRIRDLSGEVRGFEGGISMWKVSQLLDEISSCFI